MRCPDLNSDWMLWFVDRLGLMPVELEKYCWCGCNTQKLKVSKIRSLVSYVEVRNALNLKATRYTYYKSYITNAYGYLKLKFSKLQEDMKYFKIDSLL